MVQHHYKYSLAPHFDAVFNAFLFNLSFQELLKGMDANKSEVLSINLRSADFLQSELDSEEAWELRDGLKEMNARWDRLGTSLEDWREDLQRALMQCQVLKQTHILTHVCRAIVVRSSLT